MTQNGAAAKAPIAPGTFGRTVVTLANNSVGAREHWNVEVVVGGFWNNDSRPFATEAEARAYARDMVRKHHAAAAEARREELRRYLAEQDTRSRRGMHDRAGVKAAEAELAEMEGDDMRNLRDRLRAQFNEAA